MTELDEGQQKVVDMFAHIKALQEKYSIEEEDTVKAFTSATYQTFENGSRSTMLPLQRLEKIEKLVRISAAEGAADIDAEIQELYRLNLQIPAHVSITPEDRNAMRERAGIIDYSYYFDMSEYDAAEPGEYILPTREMLEALQSGDATTWNQLKAKLELEDEDKGEVLYLRGFNAHEKILSDFDLSCCDLTDLTWPIHDDKSKVLSLQLSTLFDTTAIDAYNQFEALPMAVRRKFLEERKHFDPENLSKASASVEAPIAFDPRLVEEINDTPPDPLLALPPPAPSPEEDPCDTHAPNAADTPNSNHIVQDNLEPIPFRVVKPLKETVKGLLKQRGMKVADLMERTGFVRRTYNDSLNNGVISGQSQFLATISEALSLSPEERRDLFDANLHTLKRNGRITSDDDVPNIMLEGEVKDVVRVMRERRGMTHKDLCAVIGITRTTLDVRLQKGMKEGKHLKQLSNALDASPEERAFIAAANKATLERNANARDLKNSASANDDGVSEGNVGDKTTPAADGDASGSPAQNPKDTTPSMQVSTSGLIMYGAEPLPQHGFVTTLRDAMQYRYVSSTNEDVTDAGTFAQWMQEKLPKKLPVSDEELQALWNGKAAPTEGFAERIGKMLSPKDDEKRETIQSLAAGLRSEFSTAISM